MCQQYCMYYSKYLYMYFRIMEENPSLILEKGVYGY